MPAFKPPKSRNAAITLSLLGGLAATMFAGVTALALFAHVRYVDPLHACDLHRVPELRDRTRSARSSPSSPRRRSAATTRSASSTSRPATALVLVLAANTAFNGFPLLGSVLAQDRFLPRQLHTRGDKLVYSNGILLLAGFACC